MGDKMTDLMTRHSFCEPLIFKQLVPSNGCCKSELSVASKYHKLAKREHLVKNLKHGEHYKKYEHDEVPVKDSNVTIDTDVGDRPSLTNSDLDKLELNILKNMSQDLQTVDVSTTSLESNLKFFKTTVQEIFDNFYASMRDFEIYKQRFHEILAKNEKDAVGDMEEFIKDMIQHIMLSDTSSNEGKGSENSTKMTSSIESDDNFIEYEKEASLLSTQYIKDPEEKSNSKNEPTVIEAIKNKHMMSKSDENRSTNFKAEEIYNIFLVSGTPCLQIKMNDRHLLSELNIKEPSNTLGGNNVASAENIKKVAAKKMELAKYQEQDDCDRPDREIPVKMSYAKKNIYLDEDFSQERDTEKSIISKICNFLCRKFRKP